MDLADAPTPPPAPLQAAANTLDTAGHRAWLAGDTLLALWPGANELPARTPVLSTDAPREAVLAAFPRGVPTGPASLMLPTAVGPIDLILDQSLPKSLEAAGFTAHAIAWEPASGRLHDPYDGLRDLRASRLQTIDSPGDTFDRTPLLALRALRLVSEWGLAVAPALKEGLSSTRISRSASLRTTGRDEILRALCGPHAGTALQLASTSGFAERIAPGADETLADWVDHLPPRADLRLAVWLGTSAPSWLRSWRAGRALRERVTRMARHHPLEEAAHPRRDASVGRLLTRLSGEERSWLEHARETQLASNTVAPDETERARARLKALADAMARVERNRRYTRTRTALALTGAQVVEQLACPPGPRVGRALRHLAALVEAEPDQNTPEALIQALATWAEQEPATPPGGNPTSRQTYGSQDARPKRTEARAERGQGDG